MNDVVIVSCYTINQQSVDVHIMNNPMFDMDTTLSYDNPLFEVDVDHSPKWSWAQFSPSTDTIQFSIAAVGDDQDSRVVYIVMSAYNFIFDPHVQAFYEAQC